MISSRKKRGAAQLMKHASPYVPTVDVHVNFVTVPRDSRGGTSTELKDNLSNSSLSPAVRVSPINFGQLPGETGRNQASPQDRVVHASASIWSVDVGFWDEATVTPISVESDFYLRRRLPIKEVRAGGPRPPRQPGPPGSGSNRTSRKQ